MTTKTLDLDVEKRACNVALKMDKHVDPCEDFNEYACGYFNRHAKIPEAKTEANPFDDLESKNEKIFRDILKEDNKDGDPEYLKNMRNLFQSCFNNVQTKIEGLTAYLNSSYAKEFPALNLSWNPAAFDLNNLLQRYATVSVEPFFRFLIKEDRSNSSIMRIHLEDKKLGLSKKELSKPRKDSLIMALEKYRRDFLIALHANETTAAEDAKDLVDFEIQLAMIKPTEEERRNGPARQNPITLAELHNMYTVTDVRGLILEAFYSANITLAEDEIIINEFPSYMEQLQTLLRDANPRTVQNLFGIIYAVEDVAYSTKRLKEISLEFYKARYGTRKNYPILWSCFYWVEKYFGLGLSKQFVNRKYSEEPKEYILKMFANVKAEFRQILEDITWMTNETKAASYKKLALMGAEVGYPETNFDEADLEKRYKDYKMLPDQYYENSRLCKDIQKIEALKNYREPVDKKKWRYLPHDPNAYYDPSFNEILVLAGILRPPFFSPGFPDALNYGALGSIIGHELTHGFDDQDIDGGRYDAYGTLRDWWQMSDLIQYRAKKQCIIDQYGSYRVEQLGMNLNGDLSQGENIADNGGVKESFRAYKKYISQKDDKLLKLPVLGLNNDQLFFVAYAQIWCEKSTIQDLRYRVTNSVHPPGKFRIIGPLQNFDEFAKAYNCPVGSPMNPRKKCEVW